MECNNGFTFKRGDKVVYAGGGEYHMKVFTLSSVASTLVGVKEDDGIVFDKNKLVPLNVKRANIIGKKKTYLAKIGMKEAKENEPLIMYIQISRLAQQRLKKVILDDEFTEMDIWGHTIKRHLGYRSFTSDLNTMEYVILAKDLVDTRKLEIKIDGYRYYDHLRERINNVMSKLMQDENNNVIIEMRQDDEN